jgi:hypothetical protein
LRDDAEEEPVKVIAITTQTRNQAEFVLASLHDGVEQKRFALDDLAMASKDGQGNIELHKRHGWLHRNTIGGALLKQSEALIGPGEAVVLAEGADETIDAVGDRVRSLTDGDMKTYDLRPDGADEVTGMSGNLALADHDGLLRESADVIPLQQSLLVKVPVS